MGPKETRMFWLFTVFGLMAIVLSVLAVVMDDWISYSAVVDVYDTPACRRGLTGASQVSVDYQVGSSILTCQKAGPDIHKRESSPVSSETASITSGEFTMGLKAGMHKLISLKCHISGFRFSDLHVLHQITFMSSFVLLSCALIASWIQRVSSSSEGHMSRIAMVTTYLCFLSCSAFFIMIRFHASSEVQGAMKKTLDVPDGIEGCAGHMFGRFYPTLRVSGHFSAIGFVFVLLTLLPYTLCTMNKGSDKEEKVAHMSDSDVKLILDA